MRCKWATEGTTQYLSIYMRLKNRPESIILYLGMHTQLVNYKKKDRMNRQNLVGGLGRGLHSATTPKAGYALFPDPGDGFMGDAQNTL